MVLDHPQGLRYKAVFAFGGLKTGLSRHAAMGRPAPLTCK